MTQETDVKQDEITPEDAQAAFEAGFHGKSVELDAAPAEAEKEEQKEKEEIPEPSDVEPQAKSEPGQEGVISSTVLAGLTEDQIKELFAKAARVDELEKSQSKAFGKIGELNRTLQELSSNSKQQGGILEIKQLKRFSEEFPDEAKMLLEDLQEAGIGAGSFDETKANALIESALSKVQSQMEDNFNAKLEMRLLKSMQPDYEQQLATPDWNIWKTTLKPEELKIVDESWDASELSDKINEFKAWKKKVDDHRKTEEDKRKRLAQAVVPDGVSTPRDTNDEKDAFEAGFNSVFSNRL